VIPVEGDPVDHGSVLIEEGRIRGIGAGLEAPAGAKVMEFKDAVVFPGFVDGASYLGARKQRDESARAVLLDVRMSEAVDPLDPSFDDARRAGITTFHLVPGDAGVIGGRTAVGKVLPRGQLRWLSLKAGLKVSLVESAYSGNREPTSLLGAGEMLMAAGRSAPVKALLESDTRIFASARRRREVEFGTRLGEWFGRKPVLLADCEAGQLSEMVARDTGGVVLLPVLPELKDRDRAAPARLHSAGVIFGFASEAPVRPPEALRLSAVTAVMGGLKKEAAWRALTLDSARLLGVDSRVGSLVPGKDADILVWTHEPTDPRARLLLVVQDGTVTYPVE
jgi:imidazolonepropionase-like amidohydrolase